MNVMGSLRIRYLPILFLCTGVSVPVFAAEPTPAVPQPTTLDEAAAQRKEAERMRAAAESRFNEEQAACYKKFLVNDCLADAKKRRTRSLIEARNLEAPARDFEREAHRAEVERKEAQRAVELPQREQDQQAQGEAYRAEEAAKATEREKKLADKEAQAAKGRQKSAEEAAKRQEKLAKREKMLAEKAAKREKEAAKAAEKAAAAGAKPAPAVQ